MKKIAVAIIHIYRYMLSPWVGNQCRFYPTCSFYAEQAIDQFGIIKGSYLTLLRLGKCHPWHPGGVDLLPELAPGQANPVLNTTDNKHLHETLVDSKPDKLTSLNTNNSILKK